jgi:hypothetical protein
MIPALGIGWQDLAAFALAAGAVGWLGRRAWRRRSRPGCEDCPRCASAGGTTEHASDAPAPKLLQLRTPRRRDR